MGDAPPFDSSVYEAHPSVRFEDPEEQLVRTQESCPTSRDGQNQL
ncbi:hypothetical protein Tco_0582148, partial [Tanacetum coccineum]